MLTLAFRRPSSGSLVKLRYVWIRFLRFGVSTDSYCFHTSYDR